MLEACTGTGPAGAPRVLGGSLPTGAPRGRVQHDVGIPRARGLGSEHAVKLRTQAALTKAASWRVQIASLLQASAGICLCAAAAAPCGLLSQYLMVHIIQPTA